MKLLTLSDGNGDSTATPTWFLNYLKWPEIIKLMTKGLELKNCSRYGAGNEFIVNQLKQNIDWADTAIIQWAQPNRLDLVLAHVDPTHWNNIIANDEIYKNNIVECGTNKFWLSSGSTSKEIKNYHLQYISSKQSQMRSQLFVEYAKLLLMQHDVNYRFMLVEHSEYLQVDASWVWHSPWQGLREFRTKSKYSSLDLDVAQPIPLIAFDFIKQHVMPDINLPWRNNKEIDAVENMLYRHYINALKNKPV